MANERIMLTGKIIHGGPIEWRVSPLPVEDEAPVDGCLQKLIDVGAELLELQDAIEDEDFWRKGC